MPWQDSNLPAGIRARRSFRWSFRQALHGVTEAYQLDDTSDLTSKNATTRDGVDEPGSTS